MDGAALGTLAIAIGRTRSSSVGLGRFLLGVHLLGILLSALVGIEFFSRFDLLDERDYLVNVVFDGIKSLTIHLTLPALGRTKENDVQHLIATKALVSSEGRQQGNLLVVNSAQVLNVPPNLHVIGLATVAS